MNETDFNHLVEQTLLAIEEAIEALDSSIDFETSSGVLTLSFDNGSKIILNRQIATQELWVAARSGGFHCGRRGDAWVCNTTGETLEVLLSRVCSEQAGEQIRLTLA